ncbi:alkaline phosphatase D family protein [Hydrogenophaga sp.]|uniref:alkaline phosphatase D family protein n=1 Tax=Hydrogenophaga sp. TaxID=1904254 RepID=UPI0019C84D61|nr:alkaline phosphatase D family protein [Hydrogenophaga sp.]MBD3893399.1 alkaline phosphatase [Hydrogenophaga sp.]
MPPVQPTSRRRFVIRVASASAALGVIPLLTACGGGDDAPPEFAYGVASGDPLADRVILWTHAQWPGFNDAVPLTWQVATDAAFTTVVASGTAQATAATGHAVKVDALNLSAGNDYFFRFRYGLHASPVGRTRTLPAPGAASLNLAVMSCSNFPAGFFNAYAEIARSQAQFALHLGDYIYEYAADGYASADARRLDRVSQPAHECLTLSDYRQRYAQYRSDPDSKVFHASMPIIAVWDDHELANNTYVNGAENHTEGAEGTFVARRAAALQAWHEWMPVRTPDHTDLRMIYRSFNFGGLVALHMLETRLIGRDRQVGFAELLNPATAAAAQAAMASPTRSMLGSRQLQWLQAQMAQSSAAWQVLGQPVLMARMSFPVSVLRHLNPADISPAAVAAGQQAVTNYLSAKATAAQNPALLSAEQRALLDPSQNPRLGYNLDAWDGYPVEREVLLSSAAQLRKRLVVLAGDTHNAWASQLTLRDGTVVGYEFAAPSISSPGLEEALPTLLPAQTQQTFRGIVDDLRYADTSRRGFLLVRFTPASAQGTWHFVSTVKSRTYTVQTSAPLSYAV